MPLPVALSYDTTSVRRRMKVPKIIPIFAAIGSVIIFGGCADLRQELTARAERLPDFFPGATTSEGFWRGDHFPGQAKIVVHVREQRAYFYNIRSSYGVSTVSTGKRVFDTLPGRYHVIDYYRKHV